MIHIGHYILFYYVNCMPPRKRLSKYFPNYATAYRNVGVLLIDVDPDQSQKLLQKAVILDGKNSENLIAFGQYSLFLSYIE